MTAGTKQLDSAKVQSFQQKVMEDISAASGFACAYIGDRLGLYKAMSKSGPVDSSELAKLTSTNERYIREWLINQAAGNYIDYDPATKRYSLSPENAEVLANEMSGHFAAGGFQCFMALMQAAPKIVECMRTGKGFSWGEQDPDLFEGTERFFRPAYLGQLVDVWIPSIKGLKEKLEAGATICDVGCGHGVSTITMAKAFPRSKFYGFDNHAPSIEHANKKAQEAGVADRVTFQQVEADKLPDHKFDMIAYFDCLHDMGDPVAACKSARAVLKDDGCLMIIEPMAGKTVEENFNPVGRSYSGASVLCCTPNAIASGGPALGTVASDDVLKQVVQRGGFGVFHRATETPFNRVFEARIK
jgi:2-polyprenyl-3-methyl-5-hydroxy-6-metoxy-1,4-benzoquinol methylase